MRKFTKEPTTYFARGLVCADGMFRICDQNQVNTCAKQQASSQLENQESLGELLRRASEGSLGDIG